jgi:hypothetical protein
MTAEIAILNQVGVALATDSAVTLGLGNNEKKIYNTANKLFMLSKYHPVGIMIYNSSNFMGIDWEIIIKEYRKNLGKKHFPTLKEYFKDFISFILSSTIFSSELRKNELNQQIYSIIIMLKQEVEKKWKATIELEKEITEEKAKDILIETVKQLLDRVKDENIESCSIEDFSTTFNQFLDNFYSANIVNFNGIDIKLFTELIYHSLASFKFYKGYTGIVISGYGESEIFPSIISFLSKIVVNGCFIHKVIIDESINSEQNAMILPFAQSEMVKSFMDGIDPDFNNFLDKELNVIFENINGIFPLSKPQTDLLKI